MIRLSNITVKTRQYNILNKISLKINKGDFIFLYGPNGSGKSTLIKVISGFIKPNEGEIYLEDELITSQNANLLKAKTSIIFQNIDNFFVYKTTKRDLAFSLENKQMSFEQMDEIISNLIEKYHLQDISEKDISKLSGGQKQQLALISFELDSKDILILDESFSQLDPNNHVILMNLLLQLNKQGKTIIFVTHNYAVQHSFQNTKYWYLTDEIKEFVNEHKFMFFLKKHDLIFNKSHLNILEEQRINNLPFSLNFEVIKKEHHYEN